MRDLCSFSLFIPQCSDIQSHLEGYSSRPVSRAGPSTKLISATSVFHSEIKFLKYLLWAHSQETRDFAEIMFHLKFITTWHIMHPLHCLYPQFTEKWMDFLVILHIVITRAKIIPPKNNKSTSQHKKTLCQRSCSKLTAPFPGRSMAGYSSLILYYDNKHTILIVSETGIFALL